MFSTERELELSLQNAPSRCGVRIDSLGNPWVGDGCWSAPHSPQNLSLSHPGEKVKFPNSLFAFGHAATTEQVQLFSLLLLIISWNNISSAASACTARRYRQPGNPAIPLTWRRINLGFFQIRKAIIKPSRKWQVTGLCDLETVSIKLPSCLVAAGGMVIVGPSRALERAAARAANAILVPLAVSVISL